MDSVEKKVEVFDREKRHEMVLFSQPLPLRCEENTKVKVSTYSLYVLVSRPILSVLFVPSILSGQWIRRREKEGYEESETCSFFSFRPKSRTTPWLMSESEGVC